MRNEVLLEDLGHETVHGTSGARNQLQSFAAIVFRLKGALDCLALPFDAANAGEQLRLVADRVSYTPPLRRSQ